MDIHEKIVKILMQAKNVRIGSWVTGHVMLDFGDVGKEGASYNRTFTIGDKQSLLTALEAAVDDSNNWVNPRLRKDVPKTPEDLAIFNAVCFVARTIFENCTIVADEKRYYIDVQELLLNWDPIYCESSMWYLFQWMMDRGYTYTVDNSVVLVRAATAQSIQPHSRLPHEIRRAVILGMADLLQRAPLN